MKVVPKKKRLEVYKRALEIVKSKRPAFGMCENALCFVLMCIWLKIDYYKTGDFSYHDTEVLFPEYGLYYQHLKGAIEYRTIYQEYPQDKWRKKVLKEIIKNMESC